MNDTQFSPNPDSNLNVGAISDFGTAWRQFVSLRWEEGDPVVSEALSRIVDPHAIWREYPLLLCEDPSAPAIPLARWFSRLFDADAKSFEIMSSHCDILLEGFHEALASHAMPTMREAATIARRHFAATVEMSAAGQEQLAKEWQALEPRIPTGRLLGLAEKSVLWLLCHLTRIERCDRFESYRALVEDLDAQLRSAIEADAADFGRAREPQALGRRLGSWGDRLFDVDRLSHAAKRPVGTIPLGTERLGRMQKASEIFRWTLEQWDVLSGQVTVVSDEACSTWPDMVVVDDPLAQAKTAFQERVALFVDLFKAVRIARLELRDAYKADHDEVFAEFDWRSCTADERAIFPAVVVVMDAMKLMDQHLSGIARSLATDVPLRVIALERLSRLQSLDAHHSDLGLHAMAHRNASVARTSLVESDDLSARLGETVRAQGPGFCLVATAAGDHLQSWLAMKAALFARVTPLYHYLPDAGPSWADRFSLDGSPKPESLWWRLDGDGGLAITPLDLVAVLGAGVVELDPAFEDSALVTAEHALEVPTDRVVPVLELLSDDGTKQRVIVGRFALDLMADVCDQWRQLQELGGYHNAYAEHARAQAERESDERLRALESAHAESLQGAEERGARLAMQDLARSLLNLDLSPVDREPALASLPADVEPVAPVVSQPDRADPAAVAEQVAELAAADLEEDAYIDSELCTSCHECIALNPLMFQYDDNKQAQLADSDAGTYAQLVKAAEACPARCIHPGAPRSGDPSATEEILQRATRFR